MEMGTNNKQRPLVLVTEHSIFVTGDFKAIHHIHMGQREGESREK